MNISNPEAPFIRDKISRIATLIGGSAASLAIGFAYIADHSAEGNNIVLSAPFGEKVVGFDPSEVIVGGLAVAASGILLGIASRVYDEIHKKNQ